MNMLENKIDDITVIAISGRIDLSSSKDLEEYLDKTINSNSKIIMDLSNTEYVSSSGLRVMLGALKKSKKKKSYLILASPQLMVRNVLEISGLSNIFPVYRDVEAAIRSLDHNI
jgi:anti-sigma B factor antagonist